MSPWKAICETVHLAALGLWLGVLSSAAAFAAAVFPIMRELEPRLSGYAAYQGEHWRIAGGTVAQRIFLITDVVQFACAVLSVCTLGCLIALFGLPRTRPATIIRACSLGIALACAAGTIIIVAPQLNAALRGFWAAARAGDSAAVTLHRSAVDSLHPIASRLMGGTIAFVAVAFLSGLWATVRPWNQAEPSAPRTSVYEDPALLRRKRA